MKKLSYFVLLTTITLFASCTNSSNDSSSATSRNVSVYLTDAPIPPNATPWQHYTAVNLDVKGIQYIGKDSVWKAANFTEAVFNIKLLANGDSSLLSKIQIPNGDCIRQIRFILGKNNDVILANGITKPLIIPSRSDSSLVVCVHETIPSTGNYSIMLDFDIPHSVVMDVKGSYYLIPVMRGFVVDATSSIQGYVLPLKLATKVFVVYGSDTIATASDSTRCNYFKLSGFVPGTYTVQFMPFDSARVTYTSVVNVQLGHNTNMGLVKVIR